MKKKTHCKVASVKYNSIHFWGTFQHLSSSVCSSWSWDLAGLFALIATSSVGQQRFQMGGGRHGVEMVVGGKKQIEREEKERHIGKTCLSQVTIQ
jgi:hypothetical protein